MEKTMEEPNVLPLKEELKEKTAELDLRIEQLTELAKELSEANEQLQNVYSEKRTLNEKVTDIVKRIGVKEKQLKQEQYDKSVMAGLLKALKADYDILMGAGKADEITEGVKKAQDQKQAEEEGLPLVDLDSPIVPH